MPEKESRRTFLMRAGAIAAGALVPAFGSAAGAAPRRFLYVASPGIRNYVRYGGVGFLVYDIDAGHTWVKRVPTWQVPEGEEPENVKGVVASASTGRIYLTTPMRTACFDLAAEVLVWEREYDGGCDRMSLSPDGDLLYVPSFEGPHWHVVDATNGDVVERIEVGSGAHNTIYGPDGREVYLAGLRSPYLSIANSGTHAVIRTVGPFSAPIRPFTVNGSQTLCFVNVNELLGFEIGDLKTGEMLHRVEVQGFEPGPVDRHGCPSHGIGLTPDETEIWVSDGHNSHMHVFDATVMPPRQIASLELRDQPGWVTFSMDGRFAYPSTGEVFATETKAIVATLEDETGRSVGSEKMVEVVFADGQVVQAGDQFGLGRRSEPVLRN